MWAKALAVVSMVAAVLTFEYILIRSTLSAFREDLRQRPNCTLVDDAVRKGEAPDKDVEALCRSSARGLVYSLQPEDLRALRRAR